MSDSSVDLGDLLNGSVPLDDEPVIVPDHQASEPPRPSRGRRLLGTRMPPRGSRRDKEKAEPRTKRVRNPFTPRAKRGAFVQPLTQMYGAVGMAVIMRDQVCGTAILESAEQCAKSMDELAYQNEAVRRVLHSLTKTSAMGAVLIAHAPIIMAVSMHHSDKIQRATASVPGEMMENIRETIAKQAQGAAEAAAESYDEREAA